MTTKPKDFDKGNIYLSGGMQFAQALGAGWRVKTSKKLKEMGFFPLDITELDVAYNKEHGKPISPANYEDVNEYKAVMRKHFIETDLKLIEDESDALIVYYDESARRGAGTVSEAQFAYIKGIPIFLVAEYPTEKELLDDVSGWLLSLCTKHFTNFEDLYEYLGKLPSGILRKDVYKNNGVEVQNGDKKEYHYLCGLSGEVFQKNGHKFVSTLQPMYSKKNLNIIHGVNEEQKDRYEFFQEYLTKQTGIDWK